MTLIEVLVGVAITSMISMVVGSLLFAIMTSGRTLQQQTDNYESLRLPAAMLTQDARFASMAACDWDKLKLYTGTDPSNYIQYQFGGLQDPNNLHRLVVIGGVTQRDDIVGWNLVPPALSRKKDATTFNKSPAGPNAPCGSIILVKAPLPGQTVNEHFYVTTFLRGD